MSETKLQPTDVRNSTASADEDRLWTVVEAARFLRLSPGGVVPLNFAAPHSGNSYFFPLRPIQPPCSSQLGRQPRPVSGGTAQKSALARA